MAGAGWAKKNKNGILAENAANGEKNYDVGSILFHIAAGGA